MEFVRVTRGAFPNREKHAAGHPRPQTKAIHAGPRTEKRDALRQFLDTLGAGVAGFLREQSRNTARTGGQPAARLVSFQDSSA